jgi:DNA-binding NarL/FixJ family response regulator
LIAAPRFNSGENYFQECIVAAIRILIAEDHEHLREQLAILLDGYDDFQVVAAVDNGKKAIDVSARLHPHIVLMDSNMPFMDGFTATGIIRQQFPEIKVIIFADGFVGQDKRVVESGANAVLLKPVSSQRIAQVIRQVHENTYGRTLFA